MAGAALAGAIKGAGPDVVGDGAEAVAACGGFQADFVLGCKAEIDLLVALAFGCGARRGITLAVRAEELTPLKATADGCRG